MANDLKAIADLTVFFIEKIKEECGEDLSELTSGEIAELRQSSYEHMDVTGGQHDDKEMISPKEILRRRRQLMDGVDYLESESESE